MASKICGICGKEIGMMTGKVKCVDGYICSNCFKNMGYSTLDVNALTLAGNLSIQNLQYESEKRRDNLSVIASFQPTSAPADYAKFDDYHRLMILSEKTHISYKPEHYTLFSYDQLVDFELLEDGASVASGGLGRAVVGGVLFGGVGAVVGGVTGKKKTKETCTRLAIKLTVKDYIQPAFYINIITAETKKKGLIWNTTIRAAEDTMSQLQLVTNSLEQMSYAQPNQYAQQVPYENTQYIEQNRYLEQNTYDDSGQQYGYHIAVDGQSFGPFDMDTLAQMVSRGSLTEETYVWREGMSDWAKAGSMQELQHLFYKPAPPVPPAPPMG